MGIQNLYNRTVGQGWVFKTFIPQSEPGVFKTFITAQGARDGYSKPLFRKEGQGYSNLL